MSEKVLDCNVISIILRDSECWTTSLGMRRKLEASEMSLDKRILKGSCAERLSKKEVLKTMVTKKYFKSESGKDS